MSVLVYPFLLSPILAFIIVKPNKKPEWLGVLDFILYTVGFAILSAILVGIIVLTQVSGH